jgi:hypothetical protein
VTLRLSLFCTGVVRDGQMACTQHYSQEYFHAEGGWQEARIR